MNTNAFTCPNCRTLLPPTAVGGVKACFSCRTKAEHMVFPAMFHTHQGPMQAAEVMNGESSCFYHEQKPAAAICDVCGRFLCELCQVEINGQCICPTCIQNNLNSGKIQELDNRRKLPLRIAWACVIVGFPMLIFIGAGVGAIIFGVKAFRQPPATYQVRNIVGRIGGSLAVLAGAIEVFLGIMFWMRIFFN